MVPLLLAVALTATPRPQPIENADMLEPIGWSADQHTVAFRVFFGGSFGQVNPCPGYIDAVGKQLELGLAIVVLRDGAVLHSFLIQDSPIQGSCTAPAEARKALETAKKKLDELGIDRSAPGTVLSISMEKGKPTTKTKGGAVLSTWNETWNASNGAQAIVTVAATMNDTFEDETFHKVSAAFSLKVGGRDAGTLKLGPIEWLLAGVDGFHWGLRAFASPNGETVVAFIDHVHTGRGGGTTVTMLLPLAAKK